MGKSNKHGSYERNREREALRGKRSTELPHIPGFSVKLARAQIKNLVQKGRYPIERHLMETLAPLFSREKLEEILKDPKIRKALAKAQEASQLSMFGPE